MKLWVENEEHCGEPLRGIKGKEFRSEDIVIMKAGRIVEKVSKELDKVNSTNPTGLSFFQIFRQICKIFCQILIFKWANEIYLENRIVITCNDVNYVNTIKNLRG